MVKRCLSYIIARASIMHVLLYISG